jgi:hypothetical protein
MNEMGRACSTYGEIGVVYRFLVGKPEGERRSKRRWGDNIKVDLQKVAWAAWTGLFCLGTGTGGRHF